MGGLRELSEIVSLYLCDRLVAHYYRTNYLPKLWPSFIADFRTNIKYTTQSCVCGASYPDSSHELCSVAFVAYRCHASQLLRGDTIAAIIAELMGKKSGSVKGKGGEFPFVVSVWISKRNENFLRHANFTMMCVQTNISILCSGV